MISRRTQIGEVEASPESAVGEGSSRGGLFAAGRAGAAGAAVACVVSVGDRSLSCYSSCDEERDM